MSEMGDDRRPLEAEEAAKRAAELHETHRQITKQVAETADLSADVHEQAARVHDGLGGHRLLDPDELREHAARDRELAAAERARLERDARGE